jgi:hypothetical protein
MAEAMEAERIAMEVFMVIEFGVNKTKGFE